MATTRDHAGDLGRLASLAAQPEALDELLHRALASLRQVIPYDLAVLFELEGDWLVPRITEGPLSSNPKLGQHRLALRQFPTIRRALELRRPVPMEEHHHRGDEGDPFDGILDLPRGHFCMVVPLFAADTPLGLITLDRQSCGVYPDAAVELAAVYGQIVSLAIFFAEQRRLLERYRHQLREHNHLLRTDHGALSSVDRFAHVHAPAMHKALRLARQVAAADLPVLIRGETGVGKEVLAQAIHDASPRASGPFVKLNCSAMPQALVESELFGHAKGAFSGAERERAGRFVTANGGTLLLDEIGDMPLAAQAKLLRVLQDGSFEPLGSDDTVRVDVRVLAATHVDLEEAVAKSRFREDLFYRLSVFPVEIPPLRERREDLAPLAESILQELSRRTGRGPWTIAPRARHALLDHDWPGNVRELHNTLERATILRERGRIETEHLGLPGHPHTHTLRVAGNEHDPLLPFPSHEVHERRYFEAALERSAGKIYGEDGAAALVGLKPTTLHSKLRKLGLR